MFDLVDFGAVDCIDVVCLMNCLWIQNTVKIDKTNKANKDAHECCLYHNKCLPAVMHTHTHTHTRVTSFQNVASG